MYVQIRRLFRDFDSEPQSPLQRRMLRAVDASDDAIDWDALLRGDSLQPIVLIAPTRSGKSEEMHHRARNLRAQGRCAVYAEATAIVAGLVPGLELEERKEYEGWIPSPGPLVLFVDAVDELHLKSSDLSDLIRQLNKDLDVSTRKVRFVFSARTGSWTSSSTRQVAGLARLPVEEQPRLVTFESLDDDALESLVRAQGVSDVDEFMDALHAGELSSLSELRPDDAVYLASMWRQSRHFGRWTDFLTRVVDSSAEETEQTRAHSRVLSTAETRAGLQRMAAAMLLTRLPQITSPTAASLPTAISARRLFDDWTWDRALELFENHLLVHKGHDGQAAQLPDGPLYHFLAARWLASRLTAGHDVEAVRDSLLVRVFDESSYRIPASRHAVVGWLASEAQEFRRLLLGEHPEVVLYEGDAEKLSDADIREGLRLLCARQASHSQRYWPSKVTLRKLARSTVEQEVSSLLGTYAALAIAGESSADCALETLLGLADAGHFATCLDSAVLVAQSTRIAGYARADAIGIIARLCSADRLAAALLPLTRDADPQITFALLEALVTGGVSGEVIVDLLHRPADEVMRFRLESLADKLRLDDLDSGIRAFTAILERDVVDADTELAQARIVPLVIARLRRSPPPGIDVVDALLVIDHHASHPDRFVVSHQREALTTLVRSDGHLRRVLWEARLKAFAVDARFLSLSTGPALGGATVDEFEWLFPQLSEPVMRFRVLAEAWRTTPESEQQRLLVHASPELRAYLESETARRVEGLRDQRRREIQDKRAVGRKRRQNRRALEGRRSAIESGDDLVALIGAWHEVAGASDSSDEFDLNKLQPVLGADYVEVFRRGFIACWRKQNVTIPAPGNPGLPTRALIGLAGLSVEARGGLDFATLSVADAETAAGYAFLELNAFPFWFGDLYQFHPEVVRAALAESITSAWDFTGATHGVLRFAGQCDARIARELRRVVLELLCTRPPRNTETARDAVAALLVDQKDNELVADLAFREINRTRAQPQELVEWLRLAAHLAPARTAEWILAETELAEGVLLHLAELLDNDLDERFGRVAPTQLMAPQSLARWIKVMLKTVHPAKDERLEGAHFIGPRERAERFRDRCLRRLADDASLEAHDVLELLANDPALAEHRAIFARMAEEQKQTAAEAAMATWTEEDILRWERGDEKLPRALDELFAFVIRHLRAVGRLVENDDFRYPGVFTEETPERDIQQWAASCLRQRARGLYSVVRENVVADDKEVDITASAAGVGHVPIEIKPLGSYSAGQLEAVLREQLLGRYMQPPDRRCGVLLLVRKQLQVRSFDGRKSADLEELRSWLQLRATAMASAMGKAIQVVAIDLLESERLNQKRTKVARAGRSRQPPSKERKRGKAKPATSLSRQQTADQRHRPVRQTESAAARRSRAGEPVRVRPQKRRRRR